MNRVTYIVLLHFKDLLKQGQHLLFPLKGKTLPILSLDISGLLGQFPSQGLREFS